MLLPDSLSLAEKEALSRGFDHGNYGNAYESQDWGSWSADLDDVADEGGYERAAFARGALLGFFSSYELDEIDPEIAEDVRSLRMIHDDDACATCGVTLPDDYLRATSYATRKRECPDGCDLDICADCEASTAIGTPEPHVCVATERGRG